MANLYEILDNAHDGEGVTALGREFGLTQRQTQAAINALLPAISMGLKQSTASVDGLGNLLAMMGQQQHLQAMHADPETAFGSKGVAAGNDALSVIFGSPDASRAVINQAQKFSGVDSNILKKLLPVLAGMVVSGMMRSGSTRGPEAPAQPAPSGGSLGDILGQIFGRAMQGSPGMPSGPSQQFPVPGGQATPLPPDTSGQSVPGGDLLGTILRELDKGIREGRIKPVIIDSGSIQMPMPGGQQRPMPSGPEAPQVPGGDIFGQILRDLLGGAVGGPSRMPQGRQGQPPQTKDLSDLSRQLGVMGGAGAAVFGDYFEVGRDVEQGHIENIQSVLDRYQHHKEKK